MSTNFFSSLSGSYDYVSSMSGLLSDYSSIKSGAYGSLMKSYVNKVGNKAALNAYRETGSTTTGAASEVTSSKSGSANKSSFLDSYFNDIKNSGSTPKSSSKESSDSSSTTSSTATTTTDAYAKYKSSWLDDQLKQYDKDANKTTAADTSVSYDTTI
ncbi:MULTISPECIES: hypothetical protein [unclassified Butyrivibrio]|uniref:hypothetical protein n=1 Tax=unclassified Butyrivibrio TaxID=2639466 RepID=UPI0003B57521|nr:MULTISPECIES: hypothetical protein [unclassified Butyrivibrio]MDC7292231.1 hypothetical protein [Butyrivibrio sp. DSM 10294]